jgi:hypothetical protein
MGNHELDKSIAVHFECTEIASIGAFRNYDDFSDRRFVSTGFR